MKKWYLLIILGLFLVQPILALSLNVQKLSSNEIMVAGLNEPAVFRLNVTNKGPSDNLSFYTFFGTGITPATPIAINSGESKEVDLYISPRTDLGIKGYVTFNYYIEGMDRSKVEESLTTKIIDLGDAFSLGSDSINPDSNSVQIYLDNNVNFNFQNLSINFTSPFFTSSRVVNLAPYEKKTFTITLQKSDFAKLTSGFYTISANLGVGGVLANISESIDFTEKNIINESRNQYGLIIQTTLIKESNNGNVAGNAQITVEKNIISRLFTSFSQTPDLVNRTGFNIFYTWNRQLNPGESYEVDVTTNWIIPLAVIILAVLVVVFAGKYSRTDLILRKRVVFINAKGGEFALKIMVNVEARKFVENVKVFDRLPPLVKIYEKFGGVIPKRFNKTKKVFEWELGNLEAGERRTFSYIIYSRVGVLGRFALPATYATFTKEGKPKEVYSNEAFFLASEHESE
jgi:hypothetical protein